MQAPRTEAGLVRFGVFELDLRCAELRKSGVRVPLQEQPFRILSLLLEHPGELVTREALRQQLWAADTFVDFEHGLNAAVKRLRDALGDSAETPRFIETVPRRGYRFVAPVQWPSASGADPSAVQAGPGTSARIMAALGLAVALLGLGSFLTLRDRPPLSDRDRVLLTEVVNRTGEAVLDGTLTRALAVKLEESPFLSIVSEERVRETLRLMEHPLDEPVSPALGREVCIRQGVRAMIAGEIVRLGDRYVIGLTAVECASGDVLARAQDEASAQSAILDALGRAGATLRANLGERLGSIERLDKPLPEATTPTLEALQAFSLGEEARAQGRTREAIPFYTRAIEIDPDFALAYARLAALHSNLDQFARAAEYATRAFERVHRVSERERLYILEAYQSFAGFDADQRLGIIELWVKTYPRDGRAVQRLALHHIARGECEEGLKQATEQMRLQPDAFAYGTLTLAYACLGQLERARHVAWQAIDANLDLPYLHGLLYQLALALGDRRTMQQQVEWAAGRPTEHLMRREQAHAAAALGRLGEARVLLDEAIDIAQANEVRHNAGAMAGTAAVIEALTGHRKRARARAAQAVEFSGDDVTSFWVGLALGLANDPGARHVIDRLPHGHYPVLPVPWAVAALELGRKRPDQALESLRASARHEPVDGTPFSQLLRGDAYLQLQRPADAAREFRKLVDDAGGAAGYPYLRENWRPLLRAVALARLGEAHRQAGEIQQSRGAYARFLDLWKDADPDVPLLKAAQDAYARLSEGSAER